MSTYFCFELRRPQPKAQSTARNMFVIRPVRVLEPREDQNSRVEKIFKPVAFNPKGIHASQSLMSKDDIFVNNFSGAMAFLFSQ